jgi:capsular exopolysaccharide synthesis family protein
MPFATVPSSPAVDDALEVWDGADETADAPAAAAVVRASVPAPMVEEARPARDDRDAGPADLPLLNLAAGVEEAATPSAQTLVTCTERRDAIEEYAKLAATLHNAQRTSALRTILCTSALVGEGKTVTAVNLALTLALSYRRRVLLVDADMRRPQVHTALGLPNETGLFDALEAERDRKLPVVAVSTHLSVLTAGHPGPDPVPVLTSERLGRVLDEASSQFDWVIIDSPPVLLMPDAGLLMAKVDAALLVVGAGSTPYRMVRRTVEALGRDRILGVVMNRTADALLQGAYGGYYGYYQPAAS